MLEENTQGAGRRNARRIERLGRGGYILVFGGLIWGLGSAALFLIAEVFALGRPGPSVEHTMFVVAAFFVGGLIFGVAVVLLGRGRPAGGE